MFYPVQLDLDESKVDRATVVLNPAASKRLIAKAVVALPEVKDAFANARLAVSTSTSSAFILEELTGEKVSPYCYCVGMVANGTLTTSAQEDRESARFFVKGRRVEEEARTFFEAFEKGDVAIKGANAVDAQGHVGILAGNPASGTIGTLMSRVAVRGLPVVVPVGLEKLVTSVVDAAAGWGQLTLSRSMGLPVWLFPFMAGLVVTEIEALGILTGVGARHIASGGIAGSEGAVVLLLEGHADNLAEAWDLIDAVKDEPPIPVPRHQFSC